MAFIRIDRCRVVTYDGDNVKNLLTKYAGNILDISKVLCNVAKIYIVHLQRPQYSIFKSERISRKICGRDANITSLPTRPTIECNAKIVWKKVFDLPFYIHHKLARVKHKRIAKNTFMIRMTSKDRIFTK